MSSPVTALVTESLPQPTAYDDEEFDLVPADDSVPASDTGLDFATLLPATRDLLRRKGIADADDATQEAMLKAWEHRDQFTPGTNARAWVSRIAVNAAIDRYRHRQRWLPHIHPDPEMVADIPAPEDVAEDVEMAQAFGRIDALLNEAGVTEAFREPLRLFALGYGKIEISKILGIEKGTVGSQLHRGIRQIRNHYGVDDNNPQQRSRDLFLGVRI